MTQSSTCPGSLVANVSMPMRVLSQRELSPHENRAGRSSSPDRRRTTAGAAGVTVLNQGVLLNPLRDG